LKHMWKCLSSLGVNEPARFREASIALSWSATNEVTRAVAKWFERSSYVDIHARSPIGSIVTGLVALLQNEGEFTHQLGLKISHYLANWKPSQRMSNLADARASIPAAAIDTLLEIHRMGNRNAAPVIQAALGHNNREVRLLAMEALSKIGNGQVIPKLIDLLSRHRSESENNGTLQCLKLLLSEKQDWRSDAGLQIEVAQKFEAIHVQLLLRFFRAEKHPQVWKSSLNALIQMGASEDEHLLAVVLQRVRSGEALAVEVVDQLFPKGHAAVLEAVHSMLGTASNADVLPSGLELLKRLAPEDMQEDNNMRLISVWLDHRDADFRKVALQMAADLPTGVLRNNAAMISSLRNIAGGDWPRIRRLAATILASVDTGKQVEYDPA